MTRYGYIRVSTCDQNIDRQLDGIELDQICIPERLSGKNTNRPVLQWLLSIIQPGDTIIVHSIDRLTRSLKDLIDISEQIHSKGCSLIAGSYIINNDPNSKLVMNVLASVAQWEREIIHQRVMEGIKKAQEIPNKYIGSKGRGKLKPEQIELIKSKYLTGKFSMVDLGREFNCSAVTVFNYVSNKERLW
jgi:DNA invertase Pin-like site-specific DNA recombinase